MNNFLLFVNRWNTVWNKIRHELNLYPHRPMTRFIKNNLDGELIGVEIGVRKGYNAMNMLIHLPLKKLYLIDPYEKYVVKGKILDESKNFDIMINRLSPFSDKIIVLRKKSENAVDDIPNTIDFVYLDGNHDYLFVKKDIELYYPKVRNDGIIGGHDFCGDFIGVCKAVLEFVNKNNLKLYSKNVDWWIIKPH